MPIDVVCPECRKTLRVGDHVAGKRIRCPACQAVVSVPGSVAPAAVIEDKVRGRERHADDNRPTPKRRKPERSNIDDSPVDSAVDFSDGIFDSYGHEAVLPPAPRARQRESAANTVRNSGDAGDSVLLRKHWRESMAAAAIAAVWCGLAGLLVFFARDNIEGVDPEKAENFAGTMLIFFGTLIVATLIQIPRIIPILYVSMILLGVVGAILSMIVVAGDWLMIVGSSACFVSLHRLRSVIKLLQEL